MWRRLCTGITAIAALGLLAGSAAGATASSGKPLAGRQLYLDPNTPAAAAAQSLVASDPADAALLHDIAVTPTATWFGGWNPTGEVRADVAGLMHAAGSQVPTVVAYDIVDRDCGGYSAGGAADPAAYRAWVGRLAAGLGRHRAIVIVEPDALATADCLSAADQQTRYGLLRTAVRDLTADPNAQVYLDAGHSGWHSPQDMAARLRAAGVARARGFSLNVSNFDSTAQEQPYAAAISRLLGGKHAVIDTSRNGAGAPADGSWCNPPGMALGRPPQLTRRGVVDAYLWVKYPGESDGPCNGGPTAGQFWPAYAEQLARNAGR